MNAFNDLLEDAVRPCSSLLVGECRDFVVWKPASGQVPRGWWGGSGPAKDINLVVILGEPSLKTQPGESYAANPSVAEISQFIDGLYQKKFPTKALGEELPSDRGSVHYNVMLLLQWCFGHDVSIEELKKRVWVTQAVLCSVKEGTLSTHHKLVRKTCWEMYLKRQLDLVPNAFVIPMGIKARDAVSFVAPERSTPSIDVSSAAKPQATRHRLDSETSWKRAAREFRDWQKQAI